MIFDILFCIQIAPFFDWGEKMWGTAKDELLKIQLRNLWNWLLYETNNKHHVRFVTHDSHWSDLQLWLSWLVVKYKSTEQIQSSICINYLSSFDLLKDQTCQATQSVPSSQLDTAIFSSCNCLVAILSCIMILHHDLLLKEKRRQNSSVLELYNNTVTLRIYFSTSWVSVANIFVCPSFTVALADCTRTSVDH